MLDNSFIFSLIVSGLSTLAIYFLTNRHEYKNESNYDSKELLKIFSIIFVLCFGTLYLKNRGISESNISQSPMRSGESLLSHSSRPPF